MSEQYDPADDTLQEGVAPVQVFVCQAIDPAETEYRPRLGRPQRLPETPGYTDIQPEAAKPGDE